MEVERLTPVVQRLVQDAIEDGKSRLTPLVTALIILTLVSDEIDTTRKCF